MQIQRVVKANCLRVFERYYDVCILKINDDMRLKLYG